MLFVMLDECQVACDIYEIAGEDLGTYGLLLFKIVCIQHGDIHTFFDSCLV